MKTSKTLSALFISLLTVNTLFADNFKMTEEAYIDDIPFNTEMVFHQHQANDTNDIFVLEEEAYIDDIPFDTHAIAAQHCCEKAMSQNFEMEEEAYINDIPFDTRSIALKSLIQANFQRAANNQIMVSVNQ